MIKFCLKNDTNWANKGYIIAWDQFELPYKIPNETFISIDSMKPIELIEKNSVLLFKGENFELEFDKLIGFITTYKWKNKNLIVSPLKPNFWRAFTDNDLGPAKFIPFLKRFIGRAWIKATKKVKLKTLEIEKINSKLFLIKAKYKVPNIKKYLFIQYLIYGSGDIVISVSLTPKKNMIRLGMQTEVPSEFDEMIWYGRGPHETMMDRKTGAAIGIYSGKIEDLIHNYVRPQENGNRTDVRWVSLLNKNDFGILVSDLGGTLLYVSAWPYTQEDLNKAEHIHELPRRNNITFNIDYRQRGVGGDNVIFPAIHDEYKIKKNIKYKYTFRIKGYSKDMGELYQISKLAPKINEFI